jgi:tetratricopeptide (TPR) repeat protein
MGIDIQKHRKVLAKFCDLSKIELHLTKGLFEYMAVTPEALWIVGLGFKPRPGQQFGSKNIRSYSWNQLASAEFKTDQMGVRAFIQLTTKPGLKNVEMERGMVVSTEDTIFVDPDPSGKNEGQNMTNNINQKIIAFKFSGAGETTKTCPYCAETIKVEAIKCKHCGSDMPKPEAIPPMPTPVQASVETPPISQSLLTIPPPALINVPPTVGAGSMLGSSQKQKLVSSNKLLIGCALIFGVLIILGIIVNGVKNCQKQIATEEAGAKYETSFKRGTALLAAGNFTEAKTAFIEALNIPGYSGSDYNAGDGVKICNIALGDTVAARARVENWVKTLDDTQLLQAMRGGLSPTVGYPIPDAKLKEITPAIAKAEPARREKQKKAQEEASRAEARAKEELAQLEEQKKTQEEAGRAEEKAKAELARREEQKKDQEEVGSTNSGSNRESENPSRPSVSSGQGSLISGDNWFGCTNRDYFNKLVGYSVQRDEAAFTNALIAGLHNGTCTMFKNGEVVYIADTAIFSGGVKVRRKGETQEYWTNLEAIK